MQRGHDRISEQVRGQLLALGIPGSKHTPEVLQGLFPGEFNIRAAGLDADELARVLIHFASHGLLSVSDAEARTLIKNVAPGWHCCQFYRDSQQLLELVAPYLAEGLKRGEGCFWVKPESITDQMACQAIADHVENLESYLASGQLEVMSHPRWYLEPSGRLKTFEQIAQGLLQKQDQALAKGFTFLRAAGDAGWVSGAAESRDFIDYELKVNAALGATKVAAICTYRAEVTPDELIAIVTAHQDALYNPPGN